MINIAWCATIIPNWNEVHGVGMGPSLLEWRSHTEVHTHEHTRTHDTYYYYTLLLSTMHADYCAHTHTRARMFLVLLCLRLLD